MLRTKKQSELLNDFKSCVGPQHPQRRANPRVRHRVWEETPLTSKVIPVFVALPRFALHSLYAWQERVNSNEVRQRLGWHRACGAPRGCLPTEWAGPCQYLDAEKARVIIVQTPLWIGLWNMPLPCFSVASFYSEGKGYLGRFSLERLLGAVKKKGPVQNIPMWYGKKKNVNHVTKALPSRNVIVGWMGGTIWVSFNDWGPSLWMVQMPLLLLVRSCK